MNAKVLYSLIFALVFSGLAGIVDALPVIDNIKIEAHDADNVPRNQYGIRLVRITVEGELNVGTRETLGTVQLYIDENGDGSIVGDRMIHIITGDLRLGGHELSVSGGTYITGSDDRIETNIDGEFIFRFVLPAHVVGTADVTVLLQFGNEEGDLDPQIYDDNILDPGVGNVNLGKRAFEFGVQVPILKDGDVYDYVYRNGDRIDVQLDYESPSVPLTEYEEIELLTILPDFSNVDSEFALGNSEDPPGTPLTNLGPLPNNTVGRYDVTSWNENNVDPTALDLYDLYLDVDRAVRDGRLIIDPSGGDYDVTYFIPENNRNGPGRKRLFVYALDYPFTMDLADAKDIFEAVQPTALSFPDDLNVAIWATCAIEECYDDKMGDILLDNFPPNFDFAVIDPFVNTPLRREVAPGEWAYIYKEGDTIRCMIQIDPHDLTEEELHEIDPDELGGGGDPDNFGNENGTVSNITIIGDISALLHPYKANLVTDANFNGIPDDAEVYTVWYAGANGADDDFDGGVEYTLDDDDDDTRNGFNERFLYIMLIQVTDDFRGVAGDRPYTTEPLPIRFMIEDDTGNRSYYSTWREELFDFDIWKWVEIPPSQVDVRWGRDPGPLQGTPGSPVRNPMYLDPGEGEDEIFCPDGVYTYPPGKDYQGKTTLYSSISFEPTVANAKTPYWSPGDSILANWDQPFRVIIDAAPPSVSIVRDIEQFVTTEDQDVIKGAAVVPPSGPNNINNVSETVLTDGRGGFVGPGNFIYEVTGSKDQLMTLETYYPSDDDVYFAKFQYSEDDVNFQDMKAKIFDPVEKFKQFVNGRPPRQNLLLYDIAGNITDADAPGAEYGVWHDGFSGDDDSDNDPDFLDDEVDDAHRSPLTDGVDNDVDGLVDMDDRDDENRNTEVYDRLRDEDEDGYMDEDEYVVPVRYDPFTESWVARWTFNPVRIVRILDLSPEKAYAIRALPFDLAGNAIESAAAPIYVIFRVIGPGVELSGDATVQIYKDGEPVAGQAIRENRVYDLVATTTGVVRTVTFQYSMDKRIWVNIPTAFGEPNPDRTPPFKISWRPMLDQLADDLWWDWDLDGVKDPGEPGYQSGDPLYLRALAGVFGPSLGRYQVVDGLTIDPQTFAPYAPEVLPPLTSPLAPSISTAVSDTPTLIRKLDEGWNLISICLDTDPTDVMSVLSRIEGSWDSVWTYDNNPGWRWHIRGADDSLNTLHNIVPGKGYWIKMNKDDTLVVEGTEMINTEIPLSPGPNLVGYNSFKQRHPEVALSSVAYTSILTYKDREWLKYGIEVPEFLRDLDLMEAGYGYLIYVETGCKWTLPDSGD